MKKVVIYTDGGCEGNPGPGAWAAVLRYGAHVREISGAEMATTNNRMELRAALEALTALKEECEVELHTDSQYLKKGMMEWLRGWKAKGWKTASKQPVKNADLWMALDRAASRHQLSWRWVKGHAGQPENERCDQLAGEAIEGLRKRHTKAELKAALKAFKEAEPEA